MEPDTGDRVEQNGKNPISDRIFHIFEVVLLTSVWPALRPAGANVFTDLPII